MEKVLVEKYNQIKKMKQDLTNNFINNITTDGSTETTTGNTNSIIDGDLAVTTNTPDILNLTSYFQDATHYQNNVSSSSAFLYKFSDTDYYIVTTMHSVLLNWQTTKKDGADIFSSKP